MKERRKGVRKPLAASLEIYANHVNHTEKILGKGFITNLGEGGMALETHKNLHPGDKLQLRFTLPNEKTYSVKGEIIYTQDGVLTKAYGAKFAEAPSADYRELRDYITGGKDKKTATTS